MTDYGKPTTPHDALDAFAAELRFRADRRRAEAAALLDRADEIDAVRHEVDQAARQYRKWQPQPEPSSQEALEASLTVEDAAHVVGAPFLQGARVVGSCRINDGPLRIVVEATDGKQYRLGAREVDEQWQPV